MLTVNKLCYFLSPGELKGATVEGQREHKSYSVLCWNLPIATQRWLRYRRLANQEIPNPFPEQLEESLQLELEKLPVRRAESYVTFMD